MTLRGESARCWQCERRRTMADSSVDRLLRRRLSRRGALRGVAAAGLAVPALHAPLPAGMAQGETYQVAYLTPGLTVHFWKYLSDGIKQQAATDSAETGATITVTDYDSRNDAGTQLQN